MAPSLTKSTWNTKTFGQILQSLNLEKTRLVHIQKKKTIKKAKLKHFVSFIWYSTENFDISLVNVPA